MLVATVSLLFIQSSAAFAGVSPQAPHGAGFSVGAISDISSGCAKQNAEVEQAVDPATGYIYEEWMGCGGIGFSRSTDGGQTWSSPIALPGGVGGSVSKEWDPAIAVAPSARLSGMPSVAFA